jgi:hypothetical protein
MHAERVALLPTALLAGSHAHSDGMNFGDLFGNHERGASSMNIVCASHLRWEFVFQRPQHLLSRAGRHGRVLYVEEPTPIRGTSRMDVTVHSTGCAPPYSVLSTERGQLLSALDDSLERYVRDREVFDTTTA